MRANSRNGLGQAARGCIYARVSTRDKGQDPESQLREVRAECQRTGTVITPDCEYVDRETGTGKRRRPQLERLLLDAERQRFDLLVIWSIDRLSREGTLKTLLLLDRLNRCGVKVKSLKEPWLDPTSPTYDLLLPIFAWVAKAEAQRISDRVRAGLSRAKAEGVRLGRPTVGISPERVGEEFQRWGAIRPTAKALGVSASTVARLLKQWKQSAAAEADAVCQAGGTH